jgi:hypothetical protein
MWDAYWSGNIAILRCLIQKPSKEGWSASSQTLRYIRRRSCNRALRSSVVTCRSGTVNAEHGGLVFNLDTAWIRLLSLKGSSFPPRTTCKQAVNAISIVVYVHGKAVVEFLAILRFPCNFFALHQSTNRWLFNKH